MILTAPGKYLFIRGLQLVSLRTLLKRLFYFPFRSEPWDYINQGEQGKQLTWEPVGHSNLTDWNKYCGTVRFK